jgi:hypothetical protein
MRDRFFLIRGGQDRERNLGVSGPALIQGSEPDTDILKRSPCLHCELFTRGRICPHVDDCGKIEAYQRVAAAHCTLFKSQDIRSMT